jgi:curved DNA-binding protein
MNYYKVLGVRENCTGKELRQAYRKLARQHHPDVNSGNKTAEAKFKEINEAYSVLSNAENRRKYDKYGDKWTHADQFEKADSFTRHQDAFRQTTFGRSDSRSQFNTGPGGFFDQLFTNMEHHQRRGSAEHAVQVTLEEAYGGATRLLQLSGGRRLEVKIPPGVGNNSRVRIPTGADRQGDIYLIVSVHPHRIFHRKGSNIYCDVEVSLEDAILGGEVNVPTLGGRIALTIPPEAQNGQRFRLSGQGMPDLHKPDGRGDLFATVKVILPKSLDSRERDLFVEFKALRAAKRH